MATLKDPYGTLGVTQTANATDIKAAFHRALKANHPDLHPGDAFAEMKTKEIIEAYGILSDPVRLSAWRSGATHRTAETRKADASTTAYASKYVRTASPEVQAQTDALMARCWEKFYREKAERLAKETSQLAKEAEELAAKKKSEMARKEMLIQTLRQAVFGFVGSIAAVRACIFVSSLCH